MNQDSQWEYGRVVHDQIQMVDFQGQPVYDTPTQSIMTTKLLLTDSLHCCQETMHKPMRT
jgi:hypothetical protein